MKTAFAIVCILGVCAQAQIVTNVPVLLTATVTLPTVAPAPTKWPMIILLTDIVDFNLGPRLKRVMSGPSNFTFANLSEDKLTTLYIINPGKFPIRFPTNSVWFGPALTNQIESGVLVEFVSGKVWLTP